MKNLKTQEINNQKNSINRATGQVLFANIMYFYYLLYKINITFLFPICRRYTFSGTYKIF